MRKTVLAVVMVLAVACDDDKHAAPSYPQVTSLYLVSGGDVTCDGPASQAWEPTGGPYLSGFCEWTCVSYGTQDYQRARVDFARASAGDPWQESFGANIPGRCD